MVKEQAGGDRLVPLLQEFFIVPYILLAPFVGPLADTLPKGRVMFISNGLKLIGAGHTLSVLNLCDNLTMLVLVRCYSLTVKAQLPVMHTVLSFGGLLLVGMVMLGVFRLRSSAQHHTS